MTALTPDQKAKESAVLWSILIDSILIFYFTLVGLFSGSMTFISELIRCVLLLTIEYVSYYVLRRAHRGKFQEFEFGIGKIERIVNLLVAFGLCLASLYILLKVFSMGEDIPMASSNLILAVAGADVNCMVNVYFFMAFIRVNQNEGSVIIASQIKSRLAKTVASAIVLGVLILTLWLPDPRSARMVDLTGSVFVVCYMLITAFGLIRESLPEILDRTVPEPEHFQIIRVLTAHFDQYDGFSGYKTRRSGKDLFLLLHLAFFPGTALETIETRLRPLRQALESELPGAKVTIVPEIISSPK